MEDQMPEGFSAGLVNTPAQHDPMPEGFEAGLQTQKAAASTPPPSLLSEFWAARPHPIEEAKGFIKGAGNTAAGLLDMYANAPGGIAPGVTPGTQAGARAISDAIRRHTQIKAPTADSSPEQRHAIAAQEQGDIGETIAEFYALPEVEAEKVLSKIPMLSEHLAEGAKLAKFLESNGKAARLMRIGINAVKGSARGAVEQGGQTYIKSGGDVDATEHSAGMGAVAGGALSTLGSAVGEGIGAFRQYASELAPGFLKIGQTDFPLLASENPNATLRAKASAKISGQPELLEQRQALVPQEIGNMSEGAIRRSLGRSNAEARPPITGPTGDAAIGQPTERDYLEAHVRGHEAMMVDDSFAGLDPTEQQAIQRVRDEAQRRLGEMPNPAADRAALEQQLKGYTDVMKADTFDKLLPEIQESIKGKAEALQQKLEAMPETTKLSPQQQELMDYQAIRGSRTFGRQSAEYQARINQKIDTLTEQIEKGNAWEPHDIEGAVAQGRETPQKAGDVLQAEHKPVYQAMDKANGGKLSKLHERDTDLRNALRNVSSVEEIDNIRAEIKKNDALLDQMFEDPNSGIPKAVRQQARQGWRDGAAMHDLGDILEKIAYNGITPAESAAGSNTLKRLFKGGDVLNRKLQALAEDRPEMAHLLGADGITNLKQIGKLLETPESAYEASGLLGKLASAFKSQGRRSKAVPASVIAYGPTHALAIAGAHSAAATLEGASKYITERLATDAEFNKMFAYAVKNKVSQNLSVPLLLRRLTGLALTSDDKKPPAIEDKTVVPADKKRNVQSVTLPVLQETTK